MRKAVGWLLIVGFLIFAAYYAYQNFLPHIIPPSKDVKQYLPSNNETPSPIKVPAGYKIDIFADLGLDLPRALAFDANGVIFASLTSKGKVVALPDKNFDLKSDGVVEVLSGLNKPHGLAFDGRYLYVAETDAVYRYEYDSSLIEATEKKLLFSLPSGGRHFTRTIKIYGGKLYTSVGSSCDVCLENSDKRASILISNLDGSDLKVFATGLRNTVFFDFDNQGRVWGMDMGRDNLGDTLPPEELNVIVEGKNYGWPYCYGDRIKDTKFNSDVSVDCTETEPPVFVLPAHSAPLGSTFDSAGNLLVALHGSWNSSRPVGYKVVKFNIFGGSVNDVEDYVYGFLQENDEVLGRPVDLKYDRFDNLFISDDKAGVIYVLSKI